MSPGAVTLGIVALGLIALALMLFRWRSRRKKWCMVFYMVGRLPRTLVEVNWPSGNTGQPDDASLDVKLDQVIKAISSLPCSSYGGDAAWDDDVHIVYRALWDSPTKAPLAKVVTWRLFAPKMVYFPGEDLNSVSTRDLTNDLTHYFQWVYEKCPADHYAVFFWGHSMGPGGLFEVREEPYVPSPSAAGPPVFTSANLDLTELEAAVEALVTARKSDGAPPTLPSGSKLSTDNLTVLGELLGSLAEEEAADTLPTASLPLKVEVVLFQDCWMSTLETAFQLQDTVRYVVASQSLVPIGYAADGKLGAVWPYKELIDCLLTQPDFSDPLMVILKNFFDGTLPPTPPSAGYNRIPNPTLPFTLLDLGEQKGEVSADLTVPLRALVSALIPLSKTERASLIEGPANNVVGQLYTLDQASGHLRAGEVALLDVLTLCTYLKDSSLWPASVSSILSIAQVGAITSAASAVMTALAQRPLVKSCFESADSLKLGFQGISVLWKPSIAPSGDTFLTEQVPGDHYQGLKFSVATTVGDTGQTTSWKTYAFEQHL